MFVLFLQSNAVEKYNQKKFSVWLLWLCIIVYPYHRVKAFSIAYYDRFGFNYNSDLWDISISSKAYTSIPVCLLVNILLMQRPSHSVLDSSRKWGFWIVDEWNEVRSAGRGEGVTSVTKSNATQNKYMLSINGMLLMLWYSFGLISTPIIGSRYPILRSLRFLSS